MHNSPIFTSGKSMFIILFKTKTTFTKSESGFHHFKTNYFYYLLVDCELLVLDDELPERELLPEDVERELEPEREL